MPWFKCRGGENDERLRLKRKILDGSQQPPPGYNPLATNAAHRDWFPPSGSKAVHPPPTAFTPEALALSDEEIQRTVSRLKAQGHAWDRHGPEVLDGQLSDRAMFGADPMTQTKGDGTHSGNHGYSRHATQFTSERAMAQAVKAVESSPEYLEGQRLAQDAISNNDAPEPSLIVEVPLQQAFGPNHEKQVKGRSRIGGANSPSGWQPTNLANGVVLAVYRYDLVTKSYRLHTMYPDPR